jgi:methionyl aminopeptidase
MIILKRKHELDLMREANRIVAVVLSEIGLRIKAGVSTIELDEWAEARVRQLGAEPGFKGYRGFPATLCTSINEQVVHGIPSPNCILKEGDLIGIDIGTRYKGYYGDGAYSFAVGLVSDDLRLLLETCQTALNAGVSAALQGNRVNDISAAIDKTVRARGFEIVRDLTGHGIGASLHEEPQVINYFDGRKTERLKSGMTLSIEPMITNGTYRVKTLADGWTVVTEDGSFSAHFEHTIAITDNGPEILTRI